MSLFQCHCANYLPILIALTYFRFLINQAAYYWPPKDLMREREPKKDKFLIKTSYEHIQKFLLFWDFYLRSSHSAVRFMILACLYSFLGRVWLLVHTGYSATRVSQKFCTFMVHVILQHISHNWSSSSCWKQLLWLVISWQLVLFWLAKVIWFYHAELIALNFRKLLPCTEFLCQI